MLQSCYSILVSSILQICIVCLARHVFSYIEKIPAFVLKMPRIADDIILQIKCSDYVHYFSILFGDNQRNHPQNIYVLMFIMFMQYSSSLI